MCHWLGLNQTVINSSRQLHGMSLVEHAMFLPAAAAATFGAGAAVIGASGGFSRLDSLAPLAMAGAVVDRAAAQHCQPLVVDEW